MSIDLSQLPNVWHAESLSRAKGAVVPSGFAPLDAALGGGWPAPCLIEVLIDHYGIGELTLLLPLLKSLLETYAGTLALWLNPPHALHAIALQQQGLDPARHWISQGLTEREASWAFELSLRSGACCAVIGWLQKPSAAVLRRLKLATSTGHTTGILFRGRQVSQSPSPATIRFTLVHGSTGLEMHLIKIQGRRPAQLLLDLDERRECLP